MLYIINILFSCFYLSQIKERKTWLFILKVLPVIFLWVFIVGGQYDIGADYYNYLGFFSHPQYETRFEPLFTWISRIAYNIGIAGQGQFYIYALINAVVIFIATHRLGIRHWAIFYFLLITVSTFFNNQMNGIRQCTAVVIIYWAFVELYTSKIKGASLILLATGFHYSAIVNIIFLFFEKIITVLTKYPKLLLILTLFVSLIPANESINSTLIYILPDEIAEETEYERMYIDNEDMSKEVDLMVKLSKILLIPIYWLSLQTLKRNTLSPKEQTFFRFGVLSYSLRCILLINNLVGRFSYFFWIPSILPIYYYCSDLKKRKKILEMMFILLYCSTIYFYKIFIGVAEYKSSFIYFQ